MKLTAFALSLGLLLPAVPHLHAADSLWPLDPKVVPPLEQNSDLYADIGCAVDQEEKGKFNNERIFAEHGLTTFHLEAKAEAQATGLDAFPDGTRAEFEMDAQAQLLWCQGNAHFWMDQYDKAKPILAKVWEHYPFARFHDHNGNVSLPARKAYHQWLTIGYIDAIRARKMTHYPFNPNFSIYHNARGKNLGTSIYYDPIWFAAHIVFDNDKDGPEAVEECMNQMMASKDFCCLERCDAIGLMIDAISEPGDPKEDDAWEGQRKILEEYFARHPKSGLARLAMIQFWIGYAWHARGNDVASKVTPQGWMLFEERLRKAAALLRGGMVPHPMWYQSALIVGMGMNASPEQERALFDEGVEKFPWFLGLYINMQVYLFPRWHGREGDWERFTVEMSRKINPELHAELRENAEGYLNVKSLKNDPLLDMSLETKGTLARLDRGLSWPEINQLALAACQEGDRAMAKAVFSKSACRYHPLYWKNQADFKHWREWALEK